MTEAYIEESNNSIQSQIKYSAAEQIKFGHRLAYVYIGTMKAIIIPLSAFKNKNEEIDFFSMLSEKTGI